MPAIKRYQPAARIRDRWPRGSYYNRTVIVRQDGQPLDLTLYGVFVIGLEGRNNTDGTPFLSARYDDDNGGALAGAVKIVIAPDGLDLDGNEQEASWPVQFEVVLRRAGIVDGPWIKGQVVVENGALR